MCNRIYYFGRGEGQYNRQCVLRSWKKVHTMVSLQHINFHHIGDTIQHRERLSAFGTQYICWYMTHTRNPTGFTATRRNTTASLG